MAPAPFRHVVQETTRHGRTVLYYRNRKGGRIRLPGTVGSPEFMAIYEQAPDLIKQHRRQRAERRGVPVVNKILPTLRGARTRARMQGVEFSLTENWCRETLIKQNGRCALTGMDFSLSGKGMRGRDPFGPSLDRIDPKGGYTPENTRIVLLAVNIMLADWGEVVFRKVIDGYLRTHRMGEGDG